MLKKVNQNHSDQSDSSIKWHRCIKVYKSVSSGFHWIFWIWYHLVSLSIFFHLILYFLVVKRNKRSLTPLSVMSEVCVAVLQILSNNHPPFSLCLRGTKKALFSVRTEAKKLPRGALVYIRWWFRPPWAKIYNLFKWSHIDCIVLGETQALALFRVILNVDANEC